MHTKDMLVAAEARDAATEVRKQLDVNFKDEAPKPTQLCKRWYSAFGRRDVDALMALFTSDARVVIGAGDSSSSVDYSGTYIGADMIRRFYEGRFANEAPERFACGIHENIREFNPWVIFSGNIIDRARNGYETYRGRFLHVWTTDPRQRKILSLEMYFDRSGRIPPAEWR